jgi:hypothetical protein
MAGDRAYVDYKGLIATRFFGDVPDECYPDIDNMLRLLAPVHYAPKRDWFSLGTYGGEIGVFDSLVLLREKAPLSFKRMAPILLGWFSRQSVIVSDADSVQKPVLKSHQHGPYAGASHDDLSVHTVPRPEFRAQISVVESVESQCEIVDEIEEVLEVIDVSDSVCLVSDEVEIEQSFSDGFQVSDESKMRSFIEHCVVKNEEKALMVRNACNNMHVDAHRWGSDTSGFEVIGCTEDLRQSDSVLSRRYAVLAEERARKYVRDYRDSESPDNPYEMGYCHLLFFEDPGTCLRMMEVIGPVLTPEKYNLVTTMRGIKFSDRLVSYQYYGNRLHLSYMSHLPKIKASVLWAALQQGFELTIRALNMISAVQAGSVVRSSDSFSTLFEDTLNITSDVKKEYGSARLDILDAGFEVVDSTRASFEGRGPKKKPGFETITVSGSWKGFVIQGFDVQKNADFLRHFFVMCKAYPAASIGTLGLCDRGLAAITEYLSLEGSVRSQSHAQISRALRGLLNACLNEDAMWSFVFSKIGVAAEKVFTAH